MPHLHECIYKNKVKLNTPNIGGPTQQQVYTNVSFFILKGTKNSKQGCSVIVFYSTARATHTHTAHTHTNSTYVYTQVGIVRTNRSAQESAHLMTVWTDAFDAHKQAILHRPMVIHCYNNQPSLSHPRFLSLCLRGSMSGCLYTTTWLTHGSTWHTLTHTSLNTRN